jgi:hypothetical protein
MKLTSHSYLSILALTLSRAALLSGCVSEPLDSPETEAADRASTEPAASVPLSEVPLAVQERALRHFEEVRSADLGWKDATLAAFAVPMWRPDLAEIAYYELSAFGPQGEPRGYLIVATGEHDDPLPLVSQSGPSPSARLRAKAKAEPSRFYQVGTLSFVAEDASGQLMASLGRLPQKLVWNDAEIAAVGEGAYDGFSESESPVSAPIDATHTRLESLVRRAYEPKQPLEMEQWRDWSEMKRGFAASYSRLLAERVEHARPAWQLERRLDGTTLAHAVTASPVDRLAGGVTTKQNPNGCIGQGCRPHIIKTSAHWYPEVDSLASARADQAWYGQLDKGDDYNPYKCVSGCGGTAWAMLFAWADHRASMPAADTGWDKRWGLFRKNAADYPAADAVAPLSFNSDGARRFVGGIAGELEGVLAACGEDADGNSKRWTAPNVMNDVEDWLHARSWADIKVNYSLLGRTSLDREEIVTRELQEKNRPVIAGIGHFEHYTLVYGIETTTTTVSAPGEYSSTTTERWRVNNGWGDKSVSDATISPYAFFVGRLRGGPSDKTDGQRPPNGDTTPTNAPTPGSACSNGQKKHTSCRSGETGQGIDWECLDSRWQAVSRACGPIGNGDGPSQL